MWEELRHGSRCYVRRHVGSAAAEGSWEAVKEVYQVAAVAGTLLSCIWRTRSSTAKKKRFFLYLHGFPDQSLDHRKEHPESYGQLRPQLPRRLAEKFLSARPDSAFVAFNFSGTPGSEGLSFYQKTVSQEVQDSLCMIQYLRSINDVPVHVVGISTAAIIATLLREQQLPKVTLTAIAGLLDVEKGLHYDFDEEQLASFDSQGFCFKEFWLPPGSSSNPPDAVIPEVPEAAEEPWIKCAIPLSAAYREDFLTLNVARAAKTTGTPLLILHGDRDRSVPLENGEELFRAASEPKEMVLIKGGDHLLRSSKTANKAATAILEFVTKWEST